MATKIHELKLKEDYADDILDRSKTFEIRYNDRNYQKGDYIKFNVVDRKSEKEKYHPINTIKYKITNVHSGYGLEKDFVVLSIAPDGGFK